MPTLPVSKFQNEVREKRDIVREGKRREEREEKRREESETSMVRKKRGEWMDGVKRKELRQTHMSPCGRRQITREIMLWWSNA